MSHKMLKPFTIKVSILGYIPLYKISNITEYILLNCRSLSSNVDLIIDFIFDVKPYLCFITKNLVTFV